MSNKFYDVIQCPVCGEIQIARVELGFIFNSYVNECSKCGFIITESDWETNIDVNNQDVYEALYNQCKLANKLSLDVQIPANGVCNACEKNIFTPLERGTLKTGITPQKASELLITCCPHCAVIFHKS